MRRKVSRPPTLEKRPQSNRPAAVTVWKNTLGRLFSVAAKRLHAFHFPASSASSSESETHIGGQNSSVGNVLGSLSCLMQRCGFESCSEPPVEGIFSLGVYMGSDSIPQNSFG